MNQSKKMVDLLRNFLSTLQRQYLKTIYKSFSSLHLDYGDVVSKKAFNESFH